MSGSANPEVAIDLTDHKSREEVFNDLTALAEATPISRVDGEENIFVGGWVTYVESHIDWDVIF